MIRVRIRDIYEEFENFAEALEYEETKRPSLMKHVNSIVLAMRPVSPDCYAYIDFETMAAFRIWEMRQFD
jgi:hypothetical protein